MALNFYVKKKVIRLKLRNLSTRFRTETARPPPSLNKFLTKLHQTCNVNCKPCGGKRRKTRMAQNVDSFGELVLDQENARALTNISSYLNALLNKIEAAVL